MINENLFDFPDLTKEIVLVYSNDSLMSASDFGKAVIGLTTCMSELAKVTSYPFEDIYINPIEKGSIKTSLVYIKTHPKEVLFISAAITEIFVNSISLIDRFGSGNFSNPGSEILSTIHDKKLLEMCKNYEYRKGLQAIAEPIGEITEKVNITIGKDSYEINCENKYNFFLDADKEIILPELKNGDTVELIGEITRINKTYNDLGFRYKNRIISVIPIEESTNATEFHKYLALDEVNLTGVVVRESEFVVPKIKVLSVKEVEKPVQIAFPETSE